MAFTSQYDQPYGTPQSQGPQGQQGASQTQTPDSIYNPTRAPMWKPAPSSTSQASTGLNLRDYGSQQQAAPGSPVTANGQIAPPAPTPQTSPGQPSTGQSTGGSTPVTGPPLTVPPTSPDPFQAMGGGVWTGQQWVPKNHPLAQPFLQNQGGNPSQGGAPGNAPTSPYGPYPARPQNTTYQPGQLPNQAFQAYNPASIAQYQQQDFSGLQGQQNQLLSQILSNPVLSEQVVNQMKAKQRETAMAMGAQQNQMAAQNAASRGTNLDGNLLSTQDSINNGVRENILGSYRDIDIGAAGQNRAGQLAALQAAEQVMGGQLQRRMNQYNTGVMGQQAQADENQFAHNAQFGPAEYALRAFGVQQGVNQAGAASNLDAYRTDLGAYFDNQSNQRQQDQLGLQRELGMGGLDIDRQRLATQDRQFGQTNQLNWASLLNDMAMGRYGLGLNYAQLQQQGQQDLMRNLGF